MFACGPITGHRRVPRSMAPEIAALAKSGRMPRTMVYVSQIHGKSRPHHRAWAEATEYRIIALPKEKPVDTNETGDMHVGHVHGDPDCPVRFGTHDGRVAHRADSRKLLSASRHLRLGGRDITEYIMMWLSLHPQRGRLLWISKRNSASCDTVLTTAVINKEKTNELLDIFTVGVKRLCYAEVLCQLSASGIHVTSFQRDMECDVYVRTHVYVNVVLSSGSNVVPEVCMTSTTWRLLLLQHLTSLMVHRLHLWSCCCPWL